jgi:predicted amidophosphoribosyltransferase
MPLNYRTLNNHKLLSWLELILPTQCLVCLRPLRHSRICYRCRPALPDLGELRSRSCPKCFAPQSPASHNDSCPTCKLYVPIPDTMRYLWDYEGLARDLIRTMKYRPSLEIAGICSSLLHDAIGELFSDPDWDIISPVPSSRLMLRKRLFHPCGEIAKPIAKSLKIPFSYLLKNGVQRAPQATLSHEARITRLKKLFALKDGADVTGKRILLIEDVITTGATISAAAYTLKRAGAARVDVLAMARTGVWSRFRGRVAEGLSQD